MSYRVVYPAKNCQKQVEGLLAELPDKQRDQVIDAILALAFDPRPPGCIRLKPPPKILSYLAEYRIRYGDFRVFYDVDDARHKVLLFAVCRRSEGTYRSQR